VNSKTLKFLVRRLSVVSFEGLLSSSCSPSASIGTRSHYRGRWRPWHRETGRATRDFLRRTHRGSCL